MNLHFNKNSFSVDEIHALRNYNADRRKNMSSDEIRKEIDDTIAPLLRRMEEKKKAVVLH